MNKYPIILVHGVSLKDFKFFKAFGKLEKYINSFNTPCYTSLTDGMGSIETNAIQLKEQIDDILKKHNVDKVNLICHSKGGLDAKYLINELNYGHKIASYITLNTPHKGSVFADKLYKLPKFIRNFIARYLNLIYKILGDKHPDALKACYELSTMSLNEEVLLKDTNIFVLSFSSTLKTHKGDFVMGLPYVFYKKLSGEENDGLVSLSSQKYLNYQGNIDNISHRDIVGLTLNKKRQKIVYNFYKYLLETLKENNC